jgi:hypothetical protein
VGCTLRNAVDVSELAGVDAGGAVVVGPEPAGAEPGAVVERSVATPPPRRTPVCVTVRRAGATSRRGSWCSWWSAPEGAATASGNDQTFISRKGS